MHPNVSCQRLLSIRSCFKKPCQQTCGRLNVKTASESVTSSPSLPEADTGRRHSRVHKEPAMHPHRLWSLAFLITVVCGWAVIHPAPVIGVTPVQMCTAQNVAGFPYSGSVCGGSVIDGCGPGALYTCTGGARNTTNN